MFSLEHVRHMHHETERAKKENKRLRDHIESTTGEVLDTLEMAFGAAVGGLLQGKAGPNGGKLAGIPYDLLGGLALTGLGLFEVAGEHSGHLLSIGKGLIAAYVADSTFELGAAWAAKGSLAAALKGGTAPAQVPGATTTSGALPPGMTASSLAAMAGYPVAA